MVTVFHCQWRPKNQDHLQKKNNKKKTKHNDTAQMSRLQTFLELSCEKRNTIYKTSYNSSWRDDTFLRTPLTQAVLKMQIELNCLVEQLLREFSTNVPSTHYLVNDGIW